MFGRKKHEPLDLSQPVDDCAARDAAAAVNRGDQEEATRICDETSDPRATAFASFRYID